MKPRVQLKHVLMDVDFWDNPKIIALSVVHGPGAGAAIAHVYAAMSKATNAVIDEDAIIGIADRHKVADVKAFFKYAIDKKLISPELSGFSNQNCIEDQESYAETIRKNKEEADRKRASRSGGRPAECPQDSPEDVPRSGERLPDIDIDNDLNNKKETVRLPPSHNTPAIREQIPKLEKLFRKSSKGQRGIDQDLIDAWVADRSPEKLLDSLKFTNGLTKAVNLIDRPSVAKNSTTVESEAQGPPARAAPPIYTPTESAPVSEETRRKELEYARSKGF
jgi:hypothetical protein